MTKSAASSGAELPAYRPSVIEPKWQVRWEADGLYRVPDDDVTPRDRWYLLTMFPYTSGDLHIGHWYAIAPSDTAARYQRMRGKDVLFPIGFDAFGLPAENAAIREGIHPMTWTAANVEAMREQLRRMGPSFDWAREIVTSDPDYYRWTQWWFLQLLRHDLAYRKLAPANWCPSCQTVLANEQVIRGDDEVGRCERCGSVMERRNLEQWFFRITKYADELLDFRTIDWPSRIETMQTNWIGRSEGAEIRFPLGAGVGGGDAIPVFTTRADTVFGVTYLVLAPEHPLVEVLTMPEQRDAVEAYVAAARQASEIERQSTTREKTGVFTGGSVLHPLTGAEVPVWVADYVLPSYGTGAVMGVPAHDTRDFEFATKFQLPIAVVIAPPDWDGPPLIEAYVGDGRMVNSGEFDGLSVEAGKAAVTAKLAAVGLGGASVSYRLRDWLISRQRYWGAPIPVVYCDRCGIVPVPEDELPVLLPPDAEFLPTGESPLARHDGFTQVACPECEGPARRETDTMDTFVCSSWYMFRYLDPYNDDAPLQMEQARRWLPVDQYTGGAEHAVMHLLYARFFTKAARDMGVLPVGEPFQRLFNQGTILKGGQKMSKSRGNVVNPDAFVQRLGADVVRSYLMFLGPWDRGGDWDDSGIQGLWRWLNRVWQLVLGPVKRSEDAESARAIRRRTHQMIRRVTEDMERFHFNTMLAAMMEFTNALAGERERGCVDGAAWDEAIEALVLCLAPSAPHVAEELWERLGRPYSVHQQAWPAWDAELAAAAAATLVVQVNGKVRDRLTVAVGLGEEEARAAAEGSARVAAQLTGMSIRKVVYVPDKLINLVAS